MSSEKTNKPNFDYEMHDWKSEFNGATIEESIRQIDNSEHYEMDVLHLFRLSNGKFAVVVESGGSCYDPSWAQITVHENFLEAESKFIELSS